MWSNGVPRACFLLSAASLSLIVIFILMVMGLLHHWAGTRWGWQMSKSRLSPPDIFFRKRREAQFGNLHVYLWVTWHPGCKGVWEAEYFQITSMCMCVEGNSTENSRGHTWGGRWDWKSIDYSYRTSLKAGHSIPCWWHCTIMASDITALYSCSASLNTCETVYKWIFFLSTVMAPKWGTWLNIRDWQLSPVIWKFSPFANTFAGTCHSGPRLGHDLEESSMELPEFPRRHHQRCVWRLV